MEKVAAKPCVRPLKTSRRLSPQMFWFPGRCQAINWNKKLMVVTWNVFLSKSGWHVDVKHWKQIHESNTLFVRWRIRVISHAKLGGWCLRQGGFMTEYGKSKLRTRNQFVVTPDTLFPCPWVWINQGKNQCPVTASKEVANLTTFLDTIMGMNMVRTVLCFLQSIVRNKKLQIGIKDSKIQMNVHEFVCRNKYQLPYEKLLCFAHEFAYWKWFVNAVTDIFWTMQWPCTCNL